MKKFLASFLAVAMIFGATACGSNTDAPKDAANGANTDSTTETNQNTAGDTTDSGDKETFVIGGLGPLTGGNASYGISVKQGAEVAIKEINEAGGVQVGDKTYELSLIFNDDESSEDKAIPAYNSLMDQGINALLGTVTSGPCIAVKPLAAQDNLLMITPSGSAIDCITDAPNVFRLCFTDPLQGSTMADFAVDQLGKKKIAVLYNNSDEYSTGMRDAFVEQVAAKGGEIVADEAFGKGDVDFSTQLTKIKGTDAELIFCPIYYEAAAYITKQAKDLGVELPIIGGDGWDGVLGQVTDPATVEGVIFLSPFLASDPAVADFVSKYEAAYSATPDQFAADGYDTVYVMKAAMEKAGSIESDAMIAAMTEIKVDGMTGSITFTEDGEPDKSAKFVIIKDGQYTAYDAQ